MKHFTLLFLLIISVKLITAQTTPCMVQPDSLKGTYEGACEKGKANGMGTAIGADTYIGNFKNGYPDGQGKYVWKNGNYYDGAWKKGLKEGKGEMHLKSGYKDSVVTGYWKKDTYRGQYENPYNIVDVTTRVGRVQVEKMGSRRNTVTVQVESLQAGGGFSATSAKMTSLSVIRGSYQSKSSNAMSNKEITIFQSVVFPFRATFYFGEHKVEIEIFEEGDWDITIPINK